MPSDGGLYMNGREVYRFATRVMGKAAKEVMDRAHMTADDISLFIPHQANLRIIESAAKHLGIPMDRVFVNVHNYGNTSSASIPIALCEAIDEGRIQPGDNICVVGFGAGLTWAAATIRWAPPQPTPHQSLSRRLMRISRYPLARVRSLINRAERKIDSIEESLERRRLLGDRLRNGNHVNGHGSSSNGRQPKTETTPDEREKITSRS
jgi:3-oxoacyl-[acyl-carrier-protein] synthase-3